MKNRSSHLSCQNVFWMLSVLTCLLLELVLSLENETEECFFKEPVPAAYNILYCLKGSWEALPQRQQGEPERIYQSGTAASVSRNVVGTQLRYIEI